MKLANITLSLGLIALFVGCSDTDTPRNEPQPSAGGGKADDTQQDGSITTCEDVDNDYAGCLENAPDDVDCDEFVRTEYPWGIDCCNLDDFDACGAYDLGQAFDGTCVGIHVDFQLCLENAPPDVDCNEFVRDEYPWGGNCCKLDGFDDLCIAYGSGDDGGSCAAIDNDYQGCRNEAEDVDCDAWVRGEYPWGHNCCLLDEFDDVCGAYDGSCDGIRDDYGLCRDNAPADVDCDVYLQQSYPWGDSCCGQDGFDEVCEVYG